MRRATLVLAVLAGVALAAGTALAEHPRGAGAVQTVAHGHHGHHGHHGGGHFYGGHHGSGGHYGHGYYGPPAVLYPAPVYPPVYAYPGSIHRHYYSYPGSSFYYRGRNFGLSIGF